MKRKIPALLMATVLNQSGPPSVIPIFPGMGFR